jgi:LacI family transcriptional regulator
MATIKDIAEAAGVSIGTVDRILHKRGRYSEKTAEKVRKVLKELEYTPNIHARGLKKTKSHIFGVVLPKRQQDGGYWRLVEEGVLRAARELGSYGSEVRIFPFDRYSSESCLAALSLAMESGAEGLLVAPVRPEDVRSKLEGARFPFLFIDSDIPEMTERISYIGQDSRQSGILSGKLMALLLAYTRKKDGNTRVLVIDPPGSNYHLKSRIDGFRDYMNRFLPEASLIMLKEEVDDEKRFHQYLESYFEGETLLPEGKPDGIFVANSLVYYAASFLEKKGGTFPDIPLIGYDMIPGREDFIERGVIDFILSQQPEEQGYQGVMMLYNDLILKKGVDKEVLTPLNIITRENLHTFMNDRKKNQS